MAYASANSFLGCGLETTRGTPAATIADYKWIPITTPTLTPMRKFNNDDAFRGSPVDMYDAVQSTWHTEIDCKGYVYGDTFPILLISLLGPDVVTGSSAPYTHTISLENAASSGSQPKSVTLDYFDAVNPWQVAGAQPADFEITGGADKALEWSSKLMGYAWTTLESVPTASYSDIPLIPGWDVASTIDSTSLDYISEFSLKIDRKTAPIFTQGNYSPLVIFTGPCAVSGSLTYVVPSASDPFAVGGSAWALYREQVPFTIVATDPNTADTTVTFQMSQVQFENVKRSTGKAYVESTVEFYAEANSTDAVSGYSPLQIVVENAVAAYTAS